MTVSSLRHSPQIILYSMIFLNTVSTMPSPLNHTYVMRATNTSTLLLSPQRQPIEIHTPQHVPYQSPTWHLDPTKAKSPTSTIINSKEQRRAVAFVDRVLFEMQNNKSLKGHKLNFVLDAIDAAPDSYIPFADDIWEYVQKFGVKPNQVAYSKYMKILSRRGHIQLEKAGKLVAEWMHEYQTNPETLRGKLTVLDINGPVIINQMMRAIALWSGRFGPWPRGHDAPITNVLSHESVHSALLYYFGCLMELDICPDKNTLEILWGWNKSNRFITSDVCVLLVAKAKSLRVIDCILHQILFRLVEKRAFAQFDEDHNHTISSRIWNLEEDDIKANRIYVFQLLNLNPDDPQAQRRFSLGQYA